MAQGLGLSAAEFTERYCRIVDMGMFKMVSLLEKENYDCIFLTEKGCSIYECRPVQCRTYPFWSDVVENSESWKHEATECPGINKGKHYTKEEIEEKIKQRLANKPLILR